MEPKCHLCDQKVTTDRASCWGCSCTYHTTCLRPTSAPLHPGPWHCPTCRYLYNTKGTKDVTLDTELLEYVALAKPPKTQAGVARVARFGQHIFIDKEGHLWVTGPNARPRKVPPMKSRSQIIQSTWEAAGLPNGASLYQLLRTSYFWEGMYTDCV